MTLPFERTRALVGAKEFLEAMLDLKQTPREPRWMRGRAKALPDKSGPVPPFSRRHEIPRTTEVGLDKIGAKK